MAAPAVGVVPVAVALVARVRRHAFDLSGEALVLELQRPFERLGLESAGRLVGVRRVGPLHRVADEHQQPNTR